MISGGLVTSKSHVDLIEAAAEVEVDMVGDSGAVFYLQFDNQHTFGFRARGNTVEVDFEGNSPASVSTTQPLHFWRVSEAAGNLTFEVSEDRSSWRTLTTIATPSYARAVRLVVGTDEQNPGANPTLFGGVNRNVARAQWCAADSLVDSFDQVDLGSFGTRWNNSTRIGSCTQQLGGGMAVTIQSDANADCTFASSASYRLTASSVATHVPAITTFAAGFEAYLVVRTDANRTLELAFDLDMMCAKAAGTSLGCSPYDTSQVYWRLRESSGMALFETSNDGATYTTLVATPAPFSLEAVRLEVGSRATQDLGRSIGLAFTGVNAP